jgi:hypothetical protein
MESKKNSNIYNICPMFLGPTLQSHLCIPKVHLFVKLGYAYLDLHSCHNVSSPKTDGYALGDRLWVQNPPEIEVHSRVKFELTRDWILFWGYEHVCFKEGEHTYMHEHVVHKIFYQAGAFFWKEFSLLVCSSYWSIILILKHPKKDHWPQYLQDSFSQN